MLSEKKPNGDLIPRMQTEESQTAITQELKEKTINWSFMLKKFDESSVDGSLISELEQTLGVVVDESEFETPKGENDIPIETSFDSIDDMNTQFDDPIFNDIWKSFDNFKCCLDCFLTNHF